MSTTADEDVLTVWLEDVEGRNVTVVGLCGALDMSSAPILLSAVQDQVGRRRHIILDAHLLEYVDSAGVAAILSVKNALQRFGKKLCAVGCHGVLAKTLHVTRLEAELPCFDDLDAAVSALRKRRW